MSGTAGRTPRAPVADLAGEVPRRQFVTLLEHSPDATVILDAEGRICEWNPAAERLLGWPRSGVIDTPARSLAPPEGLAQFDASWEQLVAGQVAPPPLRQWLHQDGSWVSVSTHFAPIQEGDRFAGAVAILRDDADRGASADGDVRGASASTDGDLLAGGSGLLPPLGVLERDELTGLPGRRRLQQRLAAPIPAGLARGVAVVDVDAFALVNETHGPDASDAVLRELARRLTAVAGPVDLGRWQADSFVCVLDTEDPAPALQGLGVRVAAALDEPFQVGADALRLTVSMGMVTTALAPGADLLAAAMDALRAAKDSGRDQVIWYTEALHTGSSSAFRLANDLHRGIERGELRLHYQPIMQLRTNEVVGVEALVRWERPGVGLLNPVSFIDMAERTGQIVPLGVWVVRQACLAAANLARLPNGPRSVSINVSARQLSEPGLVAMLSEALRESGCAPSMIIVEVTETALTYDLDAATATLEAIKALGVGLDLDDFGTGYSSLLYLRHFPVDRIKIDQSFVAGLGSNHADTAIVASTIALAHSIGIQAVAEGVETTEQLKGLREMGCDFAQGFLLSRPMPLDALNDWLGHHVPAPVEPTEAPAFGLEHLLGMPSLRDEVADLRDEVADGRDEVADAREALANVRDDAAAERDKAADQRDKVADDRDQPDGESETPRGTNGSDASKRARRDAQSGRARASAGRVVRASRRVQDGRHRDAATADRANGASERVQAERDRDTADVKRKAPARGRA